MKYKFKYLRVRVKPHRLGLTVARVDVSHLNKKERDAEWDRLDKKFSPEKYISCFEKVNWELPCFEKELNEIE